MLRANDDFRWFLAISAMLLLAPMPAAMAQSFTWGVNAHPGSGVYHEALGITYAQQFSLVNELGAGSVRADVFARDVVAGVWDGPDELDAIMPAADVAGVAMYPTLHPPIELRPYETADQRYTPEEIYQIAYDHARAAATKWRGQIPVWDLSNEPDGWTKLSSDFTGLQRSHYDTDRIVIAGAMLRGQADGIHAGDPDTRVSLNSGYLHTGFVDHMIDHGVNFDVISWHWYSDMGRIESAFPTGTNVLETLLAYGKPVNFGEMNARWDMTKIQAGQRDLVGEVWVTDHLRTLYRHRDRGVQGVHLYELLDSIHLGAADFQAHFGLVHVDEPAGGTPRFAVGARKEMFNKVQAVIDASNRPTVTSDGSIFSEDFDGSAVNPTRWTPQQSGLTSQITVAGGRAHLESRDRSGPNGEVLASDASLLSSLLDLDGQDEWAAEIRFRINRADAAQLSTGGSTPREIHLLSGTNAAGNSVRDFSLTLLTHPSEPALFTLGWSSWIGPTDASVLGYGVEEVSFDVYHDLVLHRGADGEFDMYFDGLWLASRSSLGGGLPERLLIGDISSLLGVNMDIDYVRVGSAIVTPVPEPVAVSWVVVAGAVLLVRHRDRRIRSQGFPRNMDKELTR